MTDHRVDGITLHVRAGTAPPAGLAEAFVRKAIARAGDIVDERFHGALVYVRRVAFARRLPPLALAESEAAWQLATELAAEIAGLAALASPVDVPAADVLVFAREADRRAAHLIRRLQDPRAAVPWWAEDLGDEDDVAVLGEEPLAPEVLTALANASDLVACLAAASPAFLEAVERMLSAAPPSADPSLPSRIGEMTATQAMMASPVPASAPRVARLALALRAGARLGPGSAPSRWLEIADRTLATPPVVAGGVVVPPEPLATPTRYAGLFCLLNLTLELGVAETLYTACVAERPLLARALAMFIPDAADAAPSLASNSSPLASMPSVGPDQAAEVARALLGATVEAFPRRGLATLPEVRLDLHGRGGHRLLVARPPTGAYALLAWPAPSAQAVAEGLRAFLSCWPRSAGRVAASPALAELVPERLSAAPRPPTAPALAAAIPEGGAASALVMQLCGTLGALAMARIDGSSPAIPAALTPHLTFPGEVVDRGDVRTIRAAAGDVSLSLRRSGLDRDPGWVPWLGRVVRFEFSGVQEP